MPRSVAVILSVFVALALTGCGGGSSNSTGAAAPTATQGSSSLQNRVVLNVTFAGAGRAASSSGLPAATSSMAIWIAQSDTGALVQGPVFVQRTPGSNSQVVTIGDLPGGTCTLLLAALDATQAPLGWFHAQPVVGGNAVSLNVNSTVDLQMVDVAPSPASLAIGTMQPFTAMATFSDEAALNLTGVVTWASDAEGTVTVSPAGQATAVSAGDTSVRAVLGGVNGVAAVHVPSGVVLQSITVPSASVRIGASRQLTATGTFSDGSSQDLASSVTWSPADPTLATVSASGLATGQAMGDTTVSATFQGVTGTGALSVLASGTPAFVPRYSTLDSYATAFGNGLFLRAMSSGYLATSTDGVTWTYRTLGVDKTVHGAIYFGNQWVVVGEGGYVATSPDLVTWTPRASGTTTDLIGIAASPAGYVAVGNGGTIVTSGDSLTWSPQTSGTLVDLHDAARVGGTWVVVGGAGTILTSPDGASWSSQGSGTPKDLYGVASNGTLTVATGVGGTVLTSADLSTWNAPASGTTEDILHGTVFGNGFAFAAGNGNVVTSADGSAWSARNVGLSRLLYGVASGNGRLVTAGVRGEYGTSPNGTTWTAYPSLLDTSFDGVAYGNGRYVAIQTLGYFCTSPDGMTWTATTYRPTLPVQSIVFGNGRFVAVDVLGQAHTSSDGLTWSAHATSVSQNLTVVTWTGTRYVAGSSSGSIIASTDGVTWTTLTQSGPAFRSLTAGNGLLVGITLIDTSVWYSTDGVTWAQAPTVTGVSVAYGSGQFVLVTGSGSTWSSTNGTTWTLHQPSTTLQLTCVTYGYGLWVAGAADGLLVSPDGVTWTAQAFAAPPYICALCAGGGRFVSVSQSDGLIMTQP